MYHRMGSLTDLLSVLEAKSEMRVQTWLIYSEDSHLAVPWFLRAESESSPVSDTNSVGPRGHPHDLI